MGGVAMPNEPQGLLPLHHSPFATRVVLCLVIGPILLFVTEPIACVLVPTIDPINGISSEPGIWQSVNTGLLRAQLAFAYLEPALCASLLAAGAQVVVSVSLRRSWLWFLLLTSILNVLVSIFFWR